MKVALVHDYIKEYGGAERVLEALHEIWLDAPVFTTVYLPKFLGPHQNRFKNWDIKTSFLQYLPFKAKLISPFRIIAPLVFKTFDFSKFDAVIVSATGAYIPNSVDCHLHICYCHTPPRYLYGYPTARDWKKNPFFKVLGEIANHFLRLVDFKAAQNVDYFISNSKEVAGRVKKFYRREAVIIYPPVETHLPGGVAPHDVPPATHLEGENPRAKSYFLAGGRLARPKNIDLIVKACIKLGVPLKIFGRGFGGYEKEFKSPAFAPSTPLRVSAGRQKSKIEYLGEVSDREKVELMRNAKAYIFASEDEDFGITPVEAMSVQTPIIAYRSGGVLETVIEGKTGLFFDQLSIESLIKTIQHFNDMNHYSEFNPRDCIKQAKKFSKERFKKEISKLVSSLYAQK